MTKCNLLLVFCRSWNHNIDAGFVYYKSLNVTYSLSTDTWICIYLIVVNKHFSFYLAALTNKKYFLSALLYTVSNPHCIFILLNLATNTHA